MDLGTVRRHHLSMALEVLVADGPASRATLARRIGVTKATASALAADLLDRGLAVEGDAEATGRVGRPAIELVANGRSVGGLGLQIDVDRVTALVLDLDGTVRARQHVHGQNAGASRDTVLGRVERAAGRVVEQAAAAGTLVMGAALAVPGLVDPTTRALRVAPNLHWLDVDLTVLDQRLDFEVVVDNEANFGALAERRLGVGAGLRSFVYVSGGVGVGGGLILDGNVVHGVHGFAGELGHVVVDPDGPSCACGASGCLETYVGSQADADPDAIARALAIALRSVVHLVDPEAVVLGGALAASPTIAAGVARELAATTLGGRWQPCEVRRSALGRDAAALGAAVTVLDAVLADPTVVPPAPPSAARTA